MNKRIFCLALALMLLFAASAQADGAGSYFRRVQYGTLVAYDNLVYGYSLGVYSRFIMLSDEQMESVWASIDENREEGDEEIYDLRIWFSPDLRYELEIQVKEPTYDSFDTEVANAAGYIDLIRDDFEPENNVRAVHDGVLRETPAGTMLETAIAYDVTDEETGKTHPVVFMYYDYYGAGVEMCFSLRDYQGDYESARTLLDNMMQTISLGLRI